MFKRVAWIALIVTAQANADALLSQFEMPPKLDRVVSAVAPESHAPRDWKAMVDLDLVQGVYGSQRDASSMEHTNVLLTYVSRSVFLLQQGQLVAGGVPEDFDYRKSQKDSEILFQHRHMEEGEIYFLANRKSRDERVIASFRVAGKQAEIWRAETGSSERAPYRIEGERTIVPLHFSPYEAYFVVFRKPAAETTVTVPHPKLSTLAKWEGGWTSRTVSVPSAWKRRGTSLLLDLGEVHEIAEVLVNGRSLGVLWHPPYRMDVSDALRAGSNRIELRVTNPSSQAAQLVGPVILQRSDYASR
jgi:alpha-L-rhamnosidase